MQLEEFLEQTAARTPDKVALIVGNRQLTYREIETEANQLAHGLIAHGVQRGDRVVLFLDNCVEAAVGVWAMEKFRHFLYGAEFTWITDCSGLRRFFEGDDLPTLLSDICMYFCGATLRPDGGCLYCQALIGHTVPLETIAVNTSWWWK